jgi:hypothetical protein
VVKGRQLRELPEPAIDPADVQALVPGLGDEEALAAARLATLLLAAAIYPRPLPDPLPPPLYLAALTAAGRLARAGDPTGSVVSESLGSYSYRLNLPTPVDEALAFTEAELGLIGPWLGRTGAYDLRTPSRMGGFVWPFDWWQRDYDDLERTFVGGGLEADTGALALSQELAVE